MYTSGSPTSRLAGMTLVAVSGPAPIASPLVPPEPMKHRNFRLEDETWFAAVRIAELRGSRVSDVAREFFRGYVRRHKRLLEGDAVWEAQVKRHAETGKWRPDAEDK